MKWGDLKVGYLLETLHGYGIIISRKKLPFEQTFYGGNEIVYDIYMFKRKSTLSLWDYCDSKIKKTVIKDIITND